MIMQLLSEWAVPVMVCAIPLYGFIRGVPVYEAFVEGGSEGLKIAARILPYMIGIFVAMGVFNASGAMNLLSGLFSGVLERIGLPAEVLPLAMVRPLSGSSALGITASILQDHGPDSFVGRLASTMQGSTDTTFYVLSLYFGSVGVRRGRHAAAAGLLGDAAGVLASLYVCRLFFG